MDKKLQQSAKNIMHIFKPVLHDITSILDIGTGTSIPISLISKLYPNIEIETLDIIDCRQKKQLQFTLYDGKTIPYANSTFNVALLNETLHHCKDPYNILNESKRVAGLVYIIEHFPKDGTQLHELYLSEFDRLKSLDLDCKIYTPFTKLSLQKLIDKVGLKILDKFKVPYLGDRPIEKYFFKIE